MNNVFQSKNFQNVRKLQVLVIKVSQLALRAQALLKAPSDEAVAEGLIAVGLCKQAKDQVQSACQNLGFVVDSLQYIASNTSELESKLRDASSAVTEALKKMLNVSETAVAPGIEGYVDEVLVIAAIMVARAEEHIKKGEQSVNKLARIAG
ncbi:MAG: hypothetical protein K2X77_03015 [Candidatus Obscuribacterales bacterium]|nr:hypothetical protein [Candidatus Obscuribacterales bacterium]